MYMIAAMNKLYDCGYGCACALHNMATLFNNQQPYISSSKFSANWGATATYVRWLLDNAAFWTRVHVHACMALSLVCVLVSQCIRALRHRYIT